MKTNIKTTFKTFIHRLNASGKLQVALTGFIVTTIAMASTVLAGGPERPTFTSASPANYVTFNSITDNPEHGDERNFVLIREAGVGTFKNEIKVQPGKEYEVYSYYHNNAKSSLNTSGVGMATNTRMSAQAPSELKPGERGIISSAITADNANPKRVWDEAYVTSDSTVSLRYITASAKIHSGGDVKNSTLSDNLFSSAGTYLGYFELNGIMPGCADYAGFVTYRIKADQPNFTLTKDVAPAGSSAWANSVNATPGTKVDYRINYKNTGTTDQKDVTIKDVLPAGMKYTPGSARLTNNAHPGGIAASDNIVGPGIGIGLYGPGAFATVTFSATVASAAELACGQLAMRNTATAITANGSRGDTADVMVTREGCAPPSPTQLPTTGPVEIAAGLIGVAAITIGIVYYAKSRRELQDALHDVHTQNGITHNTTHEHHNEPVTKDH